MKTIQEWLKGKKTYIVSFIGFFLVLLNFLTGDMSFIQFIQSPEFQWLWAFLGIGALRAGINK